MKRVALFLFHFNMRLSCYYPSYSGITVGEENIFTYAPKKFIKAVRGIFLR